MMLYSVPAFMNSFPDIVFIIKGNAKNSRNPPSCPFPVLMTPIPYIAFTHEEVTGLINGEAKGAIDEAVIGAITAGRNPPS